MSTQEAAKILGVHRDTVRRMCLAGEIRAERYGRNWWIELKALDGVVRRKRGRPELIGR